VSIRALIFEFTVTIVTKVFTKLCFVLGLDLVLLMSKLAVVSLFALVFQKVSADSFSLKLEELFLLIFATYINMFSFSCATLAQNLRKCILNFFCNPVHLL